MVYHPFKLSPAYKDYIWGGNRLLSEYNKNSNMEKLAESWELSVHPDGVSVIAEGEFAGVALSEYIDSNKEVVGKKVRELGYFPLLIKFIDAKESLSVQVHPDDEFAKEYENGLGKNEMWLVLDAEEDAELMYGFKEEISADEFSEGIEDGTICDMLNRVKVKKGDCVFIPSGTVHAIGKGIVILEIQQNSNSTYRVYDYGRVDKDGNQRPLHIEKAKKVTLLEKPKYPVTSFSEDNINFICSYFTVSVVNVDKATEFEISDLSFQAVTVTEGSGRLYCSDYEAEILKGDTVFVPAQNGKFQISGNCQVVIAKI